MILIIQIALGIVLGFVLLGILPFFINGLYKISKNIILGVGATALILGGTVLLYGAFYLLWYVSIQYLPKPILITATILSIICLLACGVVAIRFKAPISGNIWFFAVLLLGLTFLTFYSAFENYKKYGNLGEELNYVAPFFVFLSMLSVAFLLNYRNRIQNEKLP